MFLKDAILSLVLVSEILMSSCQDLHSSLLPSIPIFPLSLDENYPKHSFCKILPNPI